MEYESESEEEEEVDDGNVRKQVNSKKKTGGIFSLFTYVTIYIIIKNVTIIFFLQKLGRIKNYI